MRVESHAHVILPDIIGKAGRYGPWIEERPGGRRVIKIGPYESRVSSDRGLKMEGKEGHSDARIRLAEMDAAGTDAMVVTASPLLYLYWAEDDIRGPFVEAQNDALREYCSADSTRLAYLALLPLPDVEASIAEVRRAARAGARGVNIGTGGFGEMELDDERLWPLYAELEASRLPIFIHPYPLTMATGVEDRYNLSWIVGYNYQETVAFARMALGGVFEAFPKLEVCLTHGGGAVPYQFGRIEEARLRQPDVRATRPLTECLPNLYFDSLVHRPESRRFLLDFAGADHVLVGSNYGGWDEADGFAMLDELDLAPEEHAMVAGKNAARLFGLQSPTTNVRTTMKDTGQ